MEVSSLYKIASIYGGIKIPNSEQTQLTSQFADDTSILIEVNNPRRILALIDVLNTFRDASGLEINWNKSHAYWCSDANKPRWPEEIGW